MLYEEGGLQWIASEGGPLLLIDQHWLTAWRGHSPYPPPEGTMTDYERACTVDDYLGLISVGTGHGLVLGDEPMATAWWPLPTLQGGILVRWRWASADVSIIALLESLPNNIWTAEDIALLLPTGRAILFDSAEDEEIIESSLDLDLDSGTYQVATAEFEPDPEVALLLHRLVLARFARPGKMPRDHLGRAAQSTSATGGLAGGLR